VFPRLQLSDPLERWAVGVADCVLAPLAALGRLRPRPAAAGHPPHAIRLIRLERIGDLLMSLGAIRAVRERAPGAHIELVVGSWNEPLARLIPGVDRIETLDAPWLARSASYNGVGALISAALGWRRRRVDLAINFEGDIRSNLLLWLSGAPRRVGFGMAGGGPLLTDCVPYDTHAHVAVNSLRLVDRALGSAADAPTAVSPRLDVPAAARERAAALLRLEGAAGPIIGIHASGGRQIKQWDPGRFAEVAARLAQSHAARIVLTGSTADRPDVDRLKAALPAGIPASDLAGDIDLVTLAGVLERLTVFVTADTGPMHLAAAVGTPIVGIFGPSDPMRWGPLDPSARIVRIDLPCSPCSRIRRPPTRCVGHVPDCLAGIPANRVYETVVFVLDELALRGSSHVR
jgi:lipopolysaccharide heptosyltransferase II